MINDDRKRAIGKVISVAADRLVVEMHAGTDNFTVVGFDDVHYVARLGSFLMVPVQTDYVVVEIIGLRERDFSASTRSDGDIEKASSAKFLDVVPVGMLPKQSLGKFKFGVSVYPSLYTDALYALDSELDRIFDTALSTERAVALDKNKPLEPAEATRFRALAIGKSVVFQNYDVKIRIDDFFGGHAAILGNTGSGKSCTVASILQSLFGKGDPHYALGATFVLFDVNGEYKAALENIGHENEIRIKCESLNITDGSPQFRLPHWYLDLSEWELLLQASEKTQMPVLRTALGLTSLFKDSSSNLTPIKTHFLASCILQFMRGNESSVSKHQRAISLLRKYGTPLLNEQTFRKYEPLSYGEYKGGGGLQALMSELEENVLTEVVLPSYNNVPFSFDDLEECLDLAILYEEAHGNNQIRDYCSQLITRFKSLKDREEYSFLRHNAPDSGASPQTELEFLHDMLGLVKVSNGLIKKTQITLLDMSLVDDEVVELTAAVLARLVFKHLRRADPRNKFPVHFILEEAHRYISSGPSRYSIDASFIFERIAKEGRKYGMFLIVASQRPSELSKTVLSQCSTFIVHRIQNPDDLTQIRQMTPFISEAVLKRLPSLPKQHALVFGSSVNLPTTFKVRDASPLPNADDTKVRDLWFHNAGQLSQFVLTQAGENDK